MQDISDRILREYSFYRDGSSELRNALLEHVRPLDSKDVRNGHLFRVGDRCDSIYLVGKGNIRVYVSGMSGRGARMRQVLQAATPVLLMLQRRVGRVRETHHNISWVVRFTHPTSCDVTHENARPCAVALIAYDKRKADLAEFVWAHIDFFRSRVLVATGNTGPLLQDELGLEVECVVHSPEGGGLIIGGRVARGEADVIVGWLKTAAR